MNAKDAISDWHWKAKTRTKEKRRKKKTLSQLSDSGDRKRGKVKKGGKLKPICFPKGNEG